MSKPAAAGRCAGCAGPCRSWPTAACTSAAPGNWWRWTYFRRGSERGGVRRPAPSAVDLPDISFLRITREKTPVLYGPAVLEVFAGVGPQARVVNLAVKEMPGSGTPAEVLSAAGIDAGHIVRAVKSLL